MNWISVKDRFPEYYERVLTYSVETNDIEIMELHEGDKIKDYWYADDDDEFYNDFITHWMQLPPTPKDSE